MTSEQLKHGIKHNARRAWTTLKLAAFALVCGIICGIIGSLFVISMQTVTDLRMEHPQFMLLLPVGGAVCFYYYHLLGGDHATGTNLVINSIQSGDEIPIRMAPAIFASTVFSHMCGASVGREGAALQLGGSIGHALGRLFRFQRRNEHIMIMCGMSACFSAVFGTPIAAAIFSIEVVSVGIMHYAALVPCVISSFVARGIARCFFHIPNAFFDNQIDMERSPRVFLIVSLLAVLCGIVSILECMVLRQTGRLTAKYLKNRYLRAVVLGSILLLLTWLQGSETYNGTGLVTITAAVAGNASTIHWYTFLIKLLFTAVSLAAGYKGGEIVPTFYIGATFGYAFGMLAGISPSLCSAVAIGAVFCGVTNAPLSAILICVELFGIHGLPYFVLAIAISYATSGYYGLYPAQKIVYSKYQSDFINKKTL